MRKTVVFFAGAAILIAFAGTALADAGGNPNSNAIGPGSGVNGRKAECIPPGSAIKIYAQLPGSNGAPFGDGLSPGQEMTAACGLGPN